MKKKKINYQHNLSSSIFCTKQKIAFLKFRKSFYIMYTEHKIISNPTNHEKYNHPHLSNPLNFDPIRSIISN